MSFKSAARLSLAGCKIVFQVLKKDGFNMNKTFIPTLNRLANQSHQNHEAAAALKMINIFRTMNGVIYDGKKYGVTQALSTHFPKMTRFLPTINGSGSKRISSNSTPSSKTAQVAFVITSATRNSLKELGYSEDQIRHLKPKEALSIVESDKQYQANSTTASTTVNKTEIETGSNNDEDSIKNEKSSSFDMTSEIKKLRENLKLKKEQEVDYVTSELKTNLKSSDIDLVNHTTNKRISKESAIVIIHDDATTEK
mmetsp:Transcript_5038/g.6398  ORF Transcript_5038/g.6398 Transcript_5038/m.6398 type:complete len:254 (-) Transcript_5038:221-982(-)